MRADLFHCNCNEKTRGNSLQMRKGRFVLVLENVFFTLRVVRHWNSLLRKVVESRSLEMFKKYLDQVLGDVV